MDWMLKYQIKHGKRFNSTPQARSQIIPRMATSLPNQKGRIMEIGIMLSIQHLSTIVDLTFGRRVAISPFLMLNRGMK